MSVTNSGAGMTSDEAPADKREKRTKQKPPEQDAGEVRRHRRGSGYDDRAARMSRNPYLGDPDTDERRTGMTPHTS